MVLQRGKPVAVWGQAPAGAPVKVAFAGQTVEAEADDQGHWAVTLKPLEASAEGRTLKVAAGDQAVAIENVLVGEVWLTVGRAGPVKVLGPPVPEHLHGKIERTTNPDSDAVIAAAELPQLRLWWEGKWTVISPQTAGAMPSHAFYFGRAMHQELDVPVGCVAISSSVGTPIGWVREKTLAADPKLKAITIDRRQAYLDLYPKLVADYQKALAAYKDLPRQQRRRTPEPLPPLKIDAPGGDERTPGIGYQTYLQPLEKMTWAGVVFHEASLRSWGFAVVEDYQLLLPAIVRDWRDAFGRPDMPFILVQVPSSSVEKHRVPRQIGPQALRQDVQRRIVKDTPNAELVVTADFMGTDNEAIKHRTLGDRAALAALVRAYGKKAVPTGPLFKSVAFADGKAHITFDYVDGGLTVGGGLLRLRTSDLLGFAIAGEDRYWHWAQARIKDDRVVAWSEHVPEPKAVRYAMPEGSPVTLFNERGLPASPFRSDDWSVDLPERGEHKASVVRTPTVPKIDGRLGDGEWPGQPLTDFMIRHTYRTAAYPTKVWLTYDQENLYVGGEAAMAADYPIAKVREADNTAIVFDDAVEILLDLNRDQETYHRLAINPRRTLLDGTGFNRSKNGWDYRHMSVLLAGRGFDTQWDSNAKVATGLGEGAWTFEMAIPWKSFGLESPPAGKPIGLQLIRTAATEPFVTHGSHEELMSTALFNEWSQWVNTGRGFHTGAMMPYERNVHRPTRFGTVTLEK